MAAGGEVGSLAAYMQGRLSLSDFEWPPSQRPSLSTALSADTAHLIPEIDMQALLHSHGSTQKHELSLLRDAVSSCGFFQVCNHSIPISALQTLHSYAKRFFSMPLQQKLDISTSLGSLIEGSFRSGYMCGSPLYCPVKWWYEALKVAASNRSSIRAIAKCLWHEEADQHTFCDALEKCDTGFAKLAEQLSIILLQELGVDAEEVLKEYVEADEESIGIKLNHYPACPQPEKTLGLPGHTDICLLTVLWQDEVGGLQVLRDGRWITVKPRHDALVVNVGDIFQVWSNDHFKSGFHRAVLNNAESRYSIGFFYNPSSKSLVAPLPQLLKVANESPKFKSMLDSDYRKLGFSQLFQGKWEGVHCLRD